MGVPDHAFSVPAAWIDYNDHLTEGYYGVAFADAGDWVLAQLGFDEAYRSEHGTFYTVEAHTWFRQEVGAGAEVSIETPVLGADAKRVHFLHTMIADGERCAVQESMLLHVAQGTGRVGPMGPDMALRFAALAAEHATRERPPEIGRGIRGMPAPPATDT